MVELQNPLRNRLIEFNPWWKGPFQIPFKPRTAYEKIKKFLPLRPMITLTGLRRVGKSTVMMKIAKDAMDEGMEPKRILYFSFDEFRNAQIRDVLDTFFVLTGTNLQSGRILVMLDEIQKVSDWENQLKTLYDLNPNVKFILSGSESLFIRKKSRETLAGRIFEFKIEPLTFAEFLAFKSVTYRPLEMYEKELKNWFEEFRLSMGFPELVGISDKDIIRKYVQESIVEKTVYRDIPELFPVRDVPALQSLLSIIMESPGQLVQLHELAQELGISRQSVSSYLDYLEKSFLIVKLYNYGGNARKTHRKLKKYYPALVSVDRLFQEDEHTRSKVFEWLIVRQTRAEHFWRDVYKNEVDIVLPRETGIRPIEVKYGKADPSGLWAFMRKFKVKQGYIVSNQQTGILTKGDARISVIPAYRFLIEQEDIGKNI